MVELDPNAVALVGANVGIAFGEGEALFGAVGDDALEERAVPALVFLRKGFEERVDGDPALVVEFDADAVGAVPENVAELLAALSLLLFGKGHGFLAQGGNGHPNVNGGSNGFGPSLRASGAGCLATVCACSKVRRRLGLQPPVEPWAFESVRLNQCA